MVGKRGMFEEINIGCKGEESTWRDLLRRRKIEGLSWRRPGQEGLRVTECNKWEQWTRGSHHSDSQWWPDLGGHSRSALVCVCETACWGQKDLTYSASHNDATVSWERHHHLPTHILSSDLKFFAEVSDRVYSALSMWHCMWCLTSASPCWLA